MSNFNTVTGYRTLLTDNTDLFNAFVVYLDQKARNLEEFQKHLMHLEVRLAVIWSVLVHLKNLHLCQFAFRMVTLMTANKQKLKAAVTKLLNELTPSTWSTLRFVRLLHLH